VAPAKKILDGKLWVIAVAVILWTTTLAAAQNKPLSVEDLRILIAGGVYSSRIASLIEQNGIAFSPDARDLESLRVVGADDNLLAIIKNAGEITTQPSPRQITQQRHRIIRVLKAPTVPSQTLRPNAIAVQPTRGEQPGAGSFVVAHPKPVSKETITSSGTGVEPSIAGAQITPRNWELYRQYMPVGMEKIFSGDYSWKLPADFELNVGNTTPEILPSWYREATQAYSSGVRIVHLPDGRNDIQNYKAGEPFPNPQEPDKGYKLLADLWFAYTPYLMVGTSRNPLRMCSETYHGYSNCTELTYVFRQTAFNSDPTAAVDTSISAKYWYTEWTSVLEPEQSKYTTELILYPRNLQQEKDLYIFVPALRRWIKSSLASHCSPISGTDYMQDDFKREGFNGGLGSFSASFLGSQRILALVNDFEPLGGDFPTNYYAPLGWPKPSWGKWQLRDTDVIDVRQVASARRYCYGKRIIYEDSVTHYALWEDGYDSDFRLWKSAFLAQRWLNASPTGPVPGGFVSTVWDFKYNHLTNSTSENSEGHDTAVNHDAPPEYLDLSSYSSPQGLAEIMK
jgi:hypothetical protein